MFSMFTLMAIICKSCPKAAHIFFGNESAENWGSDRSLPPSLVFVILEKYWSTYNHVKSDIKSAERFSIIIRKLGKTGDMLESHIKSENAPITEGLKGERVLGLGVFHLKLSEFVPTVIAEGPIYPTLLI